MSNHSSTESRMDNPLQFCLQPGPPPQLSGYEIAGAMHAREEPAGDFYDYLPLSEGRVGVVVSDAVLSPHFVGHGLFATATQTFLRKLTATQSDLSQAMMQLNQLLHSQLEENSFCMCSLVILHPEARQLEHIGAGHQVYLLDPQGEYKGRLESTGLPLGLFPNATYDKTEPVQLDPGDTVLVLSDGFQETISPDHRLFGMEQVFQVMREHHTEPPATILDHLAEAAAAFRGELPQRDDMTAIMIRVDQ